MIVVVLTGPGGGRVTFLQYAVLGLAALVGLAGQAAAYLISLPEPGAAMDPSVERSRKFIRICIGPAILSVGFVPFLTSGVLSEGVTIAMLVLLLPIGLLVAGAEYAKFVLYGNWAIRIPDESLRSRANLLKFGFVIPMALHQIMSSVSVLLQFAGPGATTTAVMMSALSGLVALTLFVFSILLILMLFRLGRALMAHEAIARAIWSPDGYAGRSGSAEPADTAVVQ